MRKNILQLVQDADAASAAAAAKAKQVAAAAGVSVDLVKATPAAIAKRPFEVAGDDISAASRYGVNGIILLGSVLQHNESTSAVK